MMAQNSAADQNAPAASDNQNSATTDQNAPANQGAAADQNAPAANADQNAPANSNSKGKLPQTGSELPLLGLLGLGTVSAGVWKAYYKK